MDLATLKDAGLAGIALALVYLIATILKSQNDLNKIWLATIQDLAKSVEGFKILLNERLPRK